MTRAPDTRSGAQRARELSPQAHEREADQLRAGFSRAFGYGAIIFGLYFAIDALIYDEVRATLPLGLLLGLRVAGALLLASASRLLARRPLPLGTVTATTSSTLAATALIGAIAASQSGGFASDIADGLAFYYLGAAAFGPSPWPRMLVLVGPTYLTFFGASLLLNPLPEHGVPMALVVDLLVNAALLAFACVGSELLWRSRAHIAEVRRLGRYRLDALLERDALSETWRAHDTDTGHGVALELYRARPLADRGSSDGARITGEHLGQAVLSRDQRHRFVEAANAVATLRSPHIMRIYDCGANDDGIAFIARDFVPGERLDNLVRRTGPLEALRAIRIGRQLAEALTESHRRGIAHRDLRPWNVFVAEDYDGRDVARLIGWGLPDLIRSPEARDALAVGRGSGLFLAPEVPAGSAVRADVYGLGAVLFWCLTGQAPVELRAGEVAWRAHARSDIPRPSTLRGELLPAGLDGLVLACLERDPLARPIDAARVLALLEELPVPR